jgi:hypothetical protein
VLASLDHTLAPSRYRGLFMKASNPFAPTPVHPSAIPTFMQSQIKDPGSLLRQRRKLSPLQINMAYGSSSADKLLKVHKSLDIDGRIPWHYLEHDFVPRQDPRVYPNGGMWRDLLRREMKFPDLSVDFESIKVGKIADDGVSISVWKHMLDASDPSKAATWTELQDWFKTGQAFRITFGLMEVEDGCEDYVFEYDGPPLALLEDIITDDTGDVVFLHKDPKSKPSMGFSEQDEINLRQIEEILNAGGAAATIPKPPSPLERFNLPGDIQAFFECHRGLGGGEQGQGVAQWMGVNGKERGG